MSGPLYLYLLVLVAPWLHLLARELIWIYRHYRWLAVFCLLLVSQSTYLLEHVARVVQVHVLGISADGATGVFGVFGVQLVHVVWTSWACFCTLVLITRFPRNPWLWLALPVLALDGLLGRADTDLQFFLSVLEIAMINLAFALQLGRRYNDAWPARLLVGQTGRFEEIRLGPGDRLAHGAERVYIVTRGSGQLLRDGPGGHEILMRILAPGQIVCAGGTVLAETVLELIALPKLRNDAAVAGG